MAAFRKHPHLTARTMTGSSLGLQREQSGETEARQLRPAAARQEGQGTDAHADWAPGASLGENKVLGKSSHAHTCARSWAGRYRGDFRPHQLGARTPKPPTRGGGGARFLHRDQSGSQDSQLAGCGEGARADAHIPRPQPTPRTKWALSLPCPLTPRTLQPSPQEGEGRGGARRGSADPQPGTSQQATSRPPARRGASPAIAGRGSLSGARGSAALPRAARRGQAEVTALQAPAAGSPPRTGCSMGGGAARAGQGCFGAVRSLGLLRPRLRRWRKDQRGGEGRSAGSRSPGRRVELDASGQAWASASCASPRRAVRGAPGACTGRGSATRQSRARCGPHRPGPSCRPPHPPPPAAHPAGLRPAPRMRPVPPLKGQCVARVLCLPLQVASRTGVSVAPLVPLSPGAAKLVRSCGRSL